MASGSADVGAYLAVPLHNSTFDIQKDPFVEALQADPYQNAASMQVYFLVILSAFAVLLVLPSFVWHIRNRNLPASCLTFWALYLNLTNLINALIWPTDNIATWYWGQGYCDVAVKMQVAAPLGVIGAVVCILRSLAGALDTERLRLATSRAQAVRKQVIETLYCMGLPTLAALLHFVVQSRRYYIFAVSGCMYTVAETWVDVVLLWLWPPLLALVAAYYAGLVLVRVVRYRREFSQVLQASSHGGGSSGGMSRSRFMRLYAIACVLLVVYLPVEMYVFAWNIMLTPLGPYSWEAVHSAETWDYLLFFPAQGQVFFDRWIHISMGFALFVTLGMGADAAVFWRESLVALGFGAIFPSLLRGSASARSSGAPSSGTATTRMAAGTAMATAAAPLSSSSTSSRSLSKKWATRFGSSTAKLISGKNRASTSTSNSNSIDTANSRSSDRSMSIPLAFHQRAPSNDSAAPTLLSHDNNIDHDSDQRQSRGPDFLPLGIIVETPLRTT